KSKYTHTIDTLPTDAHALPVIPHNGTSHIFKNHLIIHIHPIARAVSIVFPAPCKMAIKVIAEELKIIANTSTRNALVPEESVNNNVFTCGNNINNPMVAPVAI